MTTPGKWHSKRHYFGLHYDLHAGKQDTELGTRSSPGHLAANLKLSRPDFVQCDCKGHPGYTSWFSRSRHASVPQSLKKDALKQWRTATRELGIPLHCHYSGIWDNAAGALHPEWCVVDAKGKKPKDKADKKMCPLGSYQEELMLPQMRELVDRYQVDGFWVDGDIWAVEPCYCKKCLLAYRHHSGGKKAPRDEKDSDWPAWWNFTRENFEDYVTRYCEAMHKYKPELLICSAWLHTLQHPGEPRVPVDWISGDVQSVGGVRQEARFMSTRGKPWDLMLWTFYRHDEKQTWCDKPLAMLQQEAAVILAFGGNVQLYENTFIRDGRLIDWRQKRFRDLGRFINKRKPFCQATESLPQVAVLHSEHHLRQQNNGRNLLWTSNIDPVRGAVNAMLENHYGVDTLDEWALRPKLNDFAAIVAPEQHDMSDEMVKDLKEYVIKGGRLIVSGAQSFKRFGNSFLGCRPGSLVNDMTYYLPVADGVVPLKSKTWRLLKTTTAKALGDLGRNQIRTDTLPHPAAVINRIGKGQVLYLPADIYRDFLVNAYPMTRKLLGTWARKLIGPLAITVAAPTGIEVILRRRHKSTFIHLVNLCSGINKAVDEIPPLGPIKITLRQKSSPTLVAARTKKTECEWVHKNGRLVIAIPRVCIHEVIEII